MLVSDQLPILKSHTPRTSFVFQQVTTQRCRWSYRIRRRAAATEGSVWMEGLRVSQMGKSLQSTTEGVFQMGKSQRTRARLTPIAQTQTPAAELACAVRTAQRCQHPHRHPHRHPWVHANKYVYPAENRPRTNVNGKAAEDVLPAVKIRHATIHVHPTKKRSSTSVDGMPAKDALSALRQRQRLRQRQCRRRRRHATQTNLPGSAGVTQLVKLKATTQPATR